MTEMISFLDLVLREDFLSFALKVFETVSPGDRFVSNWHHRAIAWELEQIEFGGNNRLIVNVPPRSLKSIIISVAWPAWLLGHDPTMSIVCVSYSNELSAKLASDCRRVMESAWYRRVFPGARLSHRRNAVHEFETIMGGVRLATSVEGTITGRGGDLIIIDDPMKAQDATSEVARRRVIDVFNAAVTQRLDDKRAGSIVVVMQRLHEDDLSGHLLDAGGWKHLCLPAINPEDRWIDIDVDERHFWLAGRLLHPEREDETVLDLLLRQMGSTAFSSQYLQNPIPAGGVMVRREWLRYYGQPPQHQFGDLIVQAWDTATKDGVLNDWSVCVTALVRRNLVYLLDVYRAKVDFPALNASVVRLARQWNAKVLLIEDAASGAQLLQVLRADSPAGVPSPIPVRPDADKVTRFAGQTPRIEAGDLILPEEAPWLASFLHELLGFPQAKHDDQVDALAHLLNWTRWRPDPEDNAGPILVDPEDPDPDWGGEYIDDPW